MRYGRAGMLAHDAPRGTLAGIAHMPPEAPIVTLIGCVAFMLGMLLYYRCYCSFCGLRSRLFPEYSEGVGYIAILSLGIGIVGCGLIGVGFEMFIGTRRVNMNAAGTFTVWCCLGMLFLWFATGRIETRARRKAVRAIEDGCGSVPTCAKCGYDLRGSLYARKTICPECGLVEKTSHLLRRFKSRFAEDGGGNAAPRRSAL
jgi:hypothetical protein